MVSEEGDGNPMTDIHIMSWNRRNLELIDVSVIVVPSESAMQQVLIIAPSYITPVSIVLMAPRDRCTIFLHTTIYKLNYS